MKNLIKKSSIGLLEYKNYRVSPDGSYIEKNGSMLTIQTDPDGYKYAYDGFDNVYIDELIARAYGLRFRGRGGYYIAHKDGNLENYDRANLEWRAVSETVRTTAGHVYFDDYTVGKDGSYFKTNGKTIEKGQRSDCRDDARKITFFKNPVVATFEKDGSVLYHCPDEYMEEAGYVTCDWTALKNPVMLHRDYDVTNYYCDNLEWVESDDPRYLKYDALRRQYMEDLVQIFFNYF